MSNLRKNAQERRRYEVLRDVKCRKLTLWHALTFTPLFTHAELEPIMATIGFFPIITDIIPRSKKQKTMRVSMDQVQWTEYELRSTSRSRTSDSDSWPRLPYPEIDGLHLASYLAFLAALESYVDPSVVMNLFLIRPIKIPYPGIRSVYKYTNTISLDSELDTGVVYFYRANTLDVSEEQYAQLRESIGDISRNGSFAKCLRKGSGRRTETDEKDDESLIRIYVFDD